MKINRRELLGGVAASIVVPSALTLDTGCSSSPDAPKHFVHGVASGDPLPDGVMLWTRVTDPSRLGANDAIEVEWQVAREPEMRTIVASGKVTTFVVCF